MSDNLQDLLLVIGVAIVALVVGVRVERVYLHEHTPIECSSEDEIAVEITEDAYGDPAGSPACVHLDALETP